MVDSEQFELVMGPMFVAWRKQISRRVILPVKRSVYNEMVGFARALRVAVRLCPPILRPKSITRALARMASCVHLVSSTRELAFRVCNRSNWRWSCLVCRTAFLHWLVDCIAALVMIEPLTGLIYQMRTTQHSLGPRSRCFISSEGDFSFYFNCISPRRKTSMMLASLTSHPRQETIDYVF